MPRKKQEEKRVKILDAAAENIFDASMDADVVATVIYSGIQGIATRWILEKMTYPLKEVADEVSRTFLKGIRPRQEHA